MMKKKLLNVCVKEQEARLYDFVNACQIVETNRIPTTGINKKGQFFINKQFYKREEKHIVGVILHESLHVYLDHINRTYDNLKIANVAHDIVINEMIFNYGYTLPTGCCTYESCNVPRSLKTSDEIYEYLLKNTPPEEMLDLHTLPEDIEVSIETDIEEIERICGSIHIELEYQKNEALKEKYTFKKKSELTNEIDRILGKYLKPEYNRTYTRPSRFKTYDIILPSSRGYVRKPSLSVYLDISSSMLGENISKSLGLLEDIGTILKSYNVKRFTFNTETSTIDDYEEVKVGGGTAFNAFHNSDNSDVALIITDCCFNLNFLEEHTKKEVIILSIGENMFVKNCKVFNL